ncbi:MAG TPA: hypothetical protein VEL75_00550 [Candidatus Methylomirabilis sp.]|nr:hypothetical protein [Candidatus Methylomirabilis sp.]
MRQIGAALLGASLLAAVGVTAAQAASEDTTGQQVGYGAGSVLGTLLYAPFKATFCILGGVTSAVTLPFGGTDTAGKVATAACGGTWVITPDVVKGQESVQFVGGGSSRQTTPGH